ncbi:MAG: alpha/beta fold hydrolase [Rhodospirillales bacterium]
MNGLACNSRSWEGQFEHFSKLNHGIGADIDIYTDCLNQLLSTLINESFLLVGHSTVGVLAGR